MEIKNLKKQTKSGQCGLYSLANILQDGDVLSFEAREELIPCGLVEMNQILKELSYPFKLAAIVDSVNYKTKIPVRFFKKIMSDLINHPNKSQNNESLCFILFIQTGNTEYSLHAVSLIINNGNYFYSDPRNDCFVEIQSIDSIIYFGNYVNAIYTFKNNQDQFCYLKLNNIHN